MASAEFTIEIPDLPKLLTAVANLGALGTASTSQLAAGLKEVSVAAEGALKEIDKVGQTKFAAVVAEEANIAQAKLVRLAEATVAQFDAIDKKFASATGASKAFSASVENGTKASSGAAKKSAEQVDEVEKLLKKNFGVEAFVGSMNRAAGALAAVGSGGAVTAARGISGVANLAQGLGQGGPAGFAVATFSVAVQQLGQYWEVEAQKEAAAHEFGIAQMREQTQAAQDLKTKLIEIATQEDALSLQQNDRVSGGVALAQARVRAAQKESGENETQIAAQQKRLADAKQQLLDVTAAQQRLDSVGPRLARGTSTLGLTAYNARQNEQKAIDDARARATSDLNDSKAQLEALGGKVSVIGDKIRGLSAEAAETAKAELTSALQAQALALAKSEQAARALALSRAQGLPATLAAIQAEREYLRAYNQQPKSQQDPAFAEKSVRDARLLVLAKDEDRAKTQDLFAAEVSLRKARNDSTTAAAALSDQLRLGLPATIANAKAQLEYFEQNKENVKIFPEFYSAKLRDIELDRRRLTLNAAIIAQRNEIALQQKAAEETAVNRKAVSFLTDTGLSNEYATAANALLVFRQKKAEFLRNTGGDEAAYLNGERQLQAQLTEITEREEGARMKARRDAAFQSILSLREQDKETAAQIRVRALARGGMDEEIAQLAVKAQTLELQRQKAAALAAEDEAAGHYESARTIRAENEVREQELLRARGAIVQRLADIEANRDAALRQEIAGSLGAFGQAFAARAAVIEKGTDGIWRLQQNAYAAAGGFRALGDAAQSGFQQVGEAVGNGLQSLATYSRATEKVAASQRLSAAETRAAVAAEIQSVLGGIAKEAGVKAVFETAEGIAAVASYRYDAATEHFAAAGVYGGIAIGAAVGGHAIGASRGNTRAENDQLKQASGTSSSAGGSGGGGSGDDRPIVYNYYNSPVLATEQAVNKRIYDGYERNRKLR